jgi:hypothetical protein
MTLDDAKRATELGSKRERLIDLARTIRMADNLLFAAGRERISGMPRIFDPITMSVEACADEFRALVAKELRAQVATIDDELRALGIDPGSIDEDQAAA